MELLVWNKSFEIGNPKVDGQHQTLIDIVNELAGAVQRDGDTQCIESILEKLEGYIQLHFTTEEELMENAAFPGFVEHRLEHLSFTRKVLELKRKSSRDAAPVSAELLDYLCGWWKDHITAEDKKIGTFMVEQRPANGCAG